MEGGTHEAPVVKDAWEEGSYIVFELTDGSRRSFPAMWSLVYDLDYKSGFRELYDQVPDKQVACQGYEGCKEILTYRFLPRDRKPECGRCQALSQMDADIFRDLAAWDKTSGDK